MLTEAGPSFHFFHFFSLLFVLPVFFCFFIAGRVDIQDGEKVPLAEQWHYYYTYTQGGALSSLWSIG